MKHHRAIASAGKAKRGGRLGRSVIVVRRYRLNRTSIHGTPQKLRDISLTKISLTENQNLAQSLRMLMFKCTTTLALGRPNGKAHVAMAGAQAVRAASSAARGSATAWAIARCGPRALRQGFRPRCPAPCRAPKPRLHARCWG